MVVIKVFPFPFASVRVVGRYERRQGLLLLVFFGGELDVIVKVEELGSQRALAFSAAAIVVVPLADHGVPRDGAEPTTDECH